MAGRGVVVPGERPTDGLRASVDAGFGILLPPGWLRIGLRDDDSRLESIVAAAARNTTPGRRPALRGYLQRSVGQAVASARGQGGTDLLLPSEPVGGTVLPVSVLVSEPRISTSVAGTPAEALVAFAGRGNAARAIEVDGRIAVRRMQDVPAADDQPARRTIGYLVHRGGTTPWLLLTASILRIADEDEEQFLQALEGVLDAMVATIRFPTRGDEESGRPA